MDVTVVGGAYREVCREPSVDRLLGSGLRAAATLADLDHSAELITCVDTSSRDELTAVAHTLRVAVIATPRSGPVTFAYDTPLHRPTPSEPAAAEPLCASGDVVLGFGMVETVWSAEASTLVVDPQHAPVSDLLERCSADRVAIVLNEHESRRLTGVRNPTAAAMALLTPPVQVVVVKQGALGGVVADRTGVEAFGAHPTPTVQPLGSGDAFSAGFTHAWACAGADPGEAARHGSRVAAAHSVTGSPQVTHFLEGVGDPLPYPDHGRPRVYLAGPFFDLGQRNLIQTSRRALQQVGVEVFSPWHDVGRGGDEVAAADLDGLRRCHSVLALLDGTDSGTLFEVGWATRDGLAVVGFAELVDDHAWIMLRGTGTPVIADLSTAVYTAAWTAVRRAATP